jgi:glycosyltransferase involved in cell wall biosynthesis
VLFVGNMMGSRHGPNIDGMLWLIKDVWPRIRRAMPEAECLLAGPMRDDVRAEVSTVEGVRILGFVEDLRALLQRVSLSVAPIRFGTGTRIKILEAMAGGCPVVSTTKGKEGLEIEVNRDLLVADDAADFATACLNLMRDVPQAERIGRAGWKAVSDRYDRIKREQWLADVLAGLIGLPQQTQRQVA